MEAVIITQEWATPGAKVFSVRVVHVLALDFIGQSGYSVIFSNNIKTAPFEQGWRFLPQESYKIQRPEGMQQASNMGNEEVGTPAKTTKVSSTQDQPPSSSPATPYADWASYQAYYNPAGTPPIPPPLGFFHSSLASNPQTHPYMWGAQHMIPPYGTPPPPYVTMFPHGVYPHPSMPPGSHPYSPYAIPSQSATTEAALLPCDLEVTGLSRGNNLLLRKVAAAGATELEGKSMEIKNRSPLKKAKRSLGSLTMLTGKSNEVEKASGASANGALSQSGESGNDGSSEGSDANSQNLPRLSSQQKTNYHRGSLNADEAQNGATSNAATQAPLIQMTNQTSPMLPVPTNVTAGPTTNLNIGMDFWGGTAPSSMATIRGKLPIAPATTAIVPSALVTSLDGVPSELWLQDERELKRQRRKQSNRESARRSRLRKQAECEELAQRVEALKEENSSLRDELELMREKCQKLAAENAALTERLEKCHGQEPRSDDIRGPADHKPERGKGQKKWLWFLEKDESNGSKKLDPTKVLTKDGDKRGIAVHV
ncbi:hypothetical protein ACLOJK_025598 [Asimina triloba]